MVEQYKIENKERGKFSKILGIGTLIAALGGAYVAGTQQDKFIALNEERTIQAKTSNLEKRIEISPSGKEYKLYSDFKPYFLIVKKSLNIEKESEVITVLNSMEEILKNLDKRKKDYGLDNSEYDYIKQIYEPNLKEYFNYVSDNLKYKFPENKELKEFKIK